MIQYSILYMLIGTHIFKDPYKKRNVSYLTHLLGGVCKFMQITYKFENKFLIIVCFLIGTIKLVSEYFKVLLRP